MSASPEVRKQRARKAVINELERLNKDGHPLNQTLLARFARCENWQQTAVAFARAVDAERRAHNATPLAPPPGWLPPLT
jgi:hypothetical protein